MAKLKPEEAAAPTPPKSKRAAPSVTVRMYRQGLGDCFLLSFPKRGGRFFVLIDCGVIHGTPRGTELMNAVAQDIAATTKNHLDVLVATHEHWDHVSGFDQAKAVFDPIAVDQVWLAWTEDPQNAVANRLREERQARLNALWQGVHQLHQRLPAKGEARDEFARAAEVLAFFGIDPTRDAPPAGGPAAGAGAGQKTGAAMAWVRDKTPHPRYFTPGEQIDLKVTGGVRVHVLGPPTDLKALRKDLPSRAHPETYEEEHPAVAERSLFGSLLGVGGAESAGFERSQPFDRKYRLAPREAARQDFFREHYLDDRDGWRRLGGEWLAGASELALQLDSDTNNTSLALAFELPGGRVLLFPGDAQVGNWESWHVADGKPRVWKSLLGDSSTAQLLARTVLYKVGHHGSHNATLREKGLEMMTHAELAAMVPVDVFIAHEKKHWGRMPFEPLMKRLALLTKGRVLQADTAVKDIKGGPGDFLGRIKDSTDIDPAKVIDVAAAGDVVVKRPLYVEYEIPLKG